MSVRLFNRDINHVEIRNFVQQTLDLDPDEIVSALVYFQRKPGQSRLPSPSDVRDVLQKEGTYEQIAARLVGRIFAGISRWGWCNAKAASEGLGELAWQCVKECVGSWQQFCESMPQDLSKQSTLRAQMRSWLVSEMERRARESIRTGKNKALIDAPEYQKINSPNKELRGHDNLIGTTIKGLAAKLDGNRAGGFHRTPSDVYQDEPRAISSPSSAEQFDD